MHYLTDIKVRDKQIPLTVRERTSKLQSPLKWASSSSTKVS